MKHKILRLCAITILSITFCFVTSAQCFAERYKTFSTVSMIIERENLGQTEILLQKRKNTGWMDGMWGLGACGHVEEGETLKQAAVRESKEELLLDIKEEDLEFVGLSHDNIKEKGIYYCMYFKVKNFSGVPTVGEPEKCEAIGWFPINDLPQETIPIQKAAIENYLHKIMYCESGWETEVI